jgi:hypothetical protein
LSTFSTAIARVRTAALAVAALACKKVRRVGMVLGIIEKFARRRFSMSY